MAQKDALPPRRKLLFVSGTSKDALEGISDRFPDIELVDCSEDRDRVRVEIADAHIVVGAITAEELAQARRLELVQVFSQGVEHLMYPEMRAHPVPVSNGRGIWSPTMAEHILGMILALYRRLHEFVRHQTDRRWARNGSVPFIYERLAGKTVGMLGAGDIAQHTIELLRPFGCPIIGINRTGAVSDAYDEVYPVHRMHDVLPRIDVLISSVPSTPDTRALLGAREFALMRSTAIFINVGRGSTVDEPALIEALRNGAVAAAGLDVFATEPLPGSSPLWELDNVLITPHMSALSPDYVHRVREILSDNLERIRDGRPIRNRVDKTAGY